MTDLRAPAPDYELRAAEPGDAAFVDALEAACMKEYALALWGEWVSSISKFGFDPSRYSIVVSGGVDCGCVDLVAREGALVLSKLYLDASVRGKGIGACLLAWARRRADALGLPLQLSVLTSNPRALAFYQREGCVELSRTDERILMEHRA